MTITPIRPDDTGEIRTDVGEGRRNLAPYLSKIFPAVCRLRADEVRAADVRPGGQGGAAQPIQPVPAATLDYHGRHRQPPGWFARALDRIPRLGGVG